ncbi:MAG: response regulator [Desulfovibrio sp.]|uniref:ATP-binding protein n=1 Tax=Desulfovibrio sp. TaxID=885 RepID=UPI00135D5B6F|nr:ATP-binding protein [Desulfovibrio sp.]MTJ92096.1 response regulator [Desulfovibrio sp.]
MIVFFSGISGAVLRVCALFLCIFCASFGAPSTAHSGTIPPVLRAPSVSLLPDLQYFIDVTGTMDVEEAAAPSNSQMFKPLNVKALPRLAGVMWLRFTLAPLPAGGRSQAMLLDMGPDVPADPVLYQPAPSPVADSIEWREILPTHRNVLLLPEPGTEAITCYIRLDGLPGIWFSPTLRTPQDAATNWGSLSGTAALLALGVVMLLCLLRGLSERGQWRVWTALYVGVALLQGTLGMPAYGTGHITLNQAVAVLAPGLALMLLPHVGRHLMRTRGRSPLLDAQFVLLSLPGAALALLPLLPGFGWSIRFLSLWPACTAIFTLSALGGAIMGLGGARRFLLGCIVPPLFVAAGIMGLDYGYAANLLASAPLWGTALSALLIAGTGLPRDAAQTGNDRADTSGTEPGKGKKRESSPAAKRSIAGLDAALVSSGLNDGPINLDAPLDDPNLRLLPPSAAGKTAADFSALPVDISDNAEPAPRAQRASRQGAAPASVSPGMWENLLRPPLDRLMREGAALGHCSLPPAVRQYAENMINAAGDLAKILDNPGETQEHTGVGEQRSPFNLQHLVREAHDAVTTAAENAGIGLAWYMPPLLGHMYEGQARALRETLSLLLESAVRATSRGAVHLSVRRVPETADPGHLLFTVSDNGAGIPPRDRSALALTRAWELAGSNNGYLNVECGPQGTSIAFTLRLKPLENAGESDKAAAQARGPHIAVVAESAVDRQALAHMIANLGYNSTESRSMREALQCNREAPALMLVVQYPHHGPAEADALGRFEAEALETGLSVFKALAITKDDKNWDALAETGYTHALLDPVDAEAFAATLNEVLTEGGFLGGSPAASTGETPAVSAAEPEMPDQTGVALAAAAAGSTIAEASTVDAASSVESATESQPIDLSDLSDSSYLPPAAQEHPVDAPAQALTPNGLPDLFGEDAPAQGSLLPAVEQHDLTQRDLSQSDHAPTPPVSDLQLPLSYEEPLSFGTQEKLSVHHSADQGSLLLPLMDEAQQEEDQAPIELTDLLPEEGKPGDDDQLPLSMTEAAEAELPEVLTETAPDNAADTLPDIKMETAPAPAAESPDMQAETLTDAASENQPEERPEAVTEAVAEPKTESVQEAPSEILTEPQTAEEAPAASASSEFVADEFLASAGLEGPHWSAEDTATPDQPAATEMLTEHTEITTEIYAGDVVAKVQAFEQLAWPEPAHAEPVQTEPVQSEPVQSDAAQLDTPAVDARASITPAEFIEASLPVEDTYAEPAEATAELAAEVLAAQTITPLKSMSDRVGEATLSPVNGAASFADSIADTDSENASAKGSGFDVPAPAGRGAWDNYSLHEEWVGEPMPIGTPVPTARMTTPAQPARQSSAQGSAPASAANAATRQEKKSYVSPSLAHPGEWVGEPMPMTKPARQEEPDAAQQPAEAQADDRRNRPVEMPRTATGRLILKLLGSAGDRPADTEKEAAASGRPDLMADLAAMPMQDAAPASPPIAEQVSAQVSMPGAAPAAAEPRRAATALKTSGKGNSIMNFIAGAADALRHPDHSAAPQAEQRAEQKTQPVADATAYEPMKTPERTSAASSTVGSAQPAAPASVPPAALVAPNAPRETDQTIPQLVARLDTAMDDAQQGFKNRRCAVVGEAANRIATESDAFGFRVLARMARCVERAAKANDMNALRDLLPELAVAVERNRIGLTPRR